jgi:hypothetical protein
MLCIPTEKDRNGKPQTQANPEHAVSQLHRNQIPSAFQFSSPHTATRLSELLQQAAFVFPYQQNQLNPEEDMTRVS